MKQFIKQDKAWGGRVGELAIEYNRSYEEELNRATYKALEKDDSWFIFFAVVGLFKL